MRRALLALPLVIACSDYDLRTQDDHPVVNDDDTDPIATGPNPDIVVDPMSLDFGTLGIDCVSDPETVTVTNVGDADLVVTDIELDGAGYTAFDLSGAPRTLPPGQSFTFEVTFAPESIADYSDVDVAVASNDPDESEVRVGLLGEGGQYSYYEEMWQQPNPKSVDVLWVVDNSGSMSDIVEHLGDRFNSFIGAFSAMGLDYQIGVTTTDMFDPTQSGRLQGPVKVISTATTSDPIGAFVAATDLGSSGSGDERGLEAAYAALTDPLLSTTNAGLVRDDGILAVVVISDENDGSDMSVSTFTSWLNGYKGGDASLSSFSAVVGPKPTGCLKWDFPPVQAEAGGRYIDAATATGGASISICELDFDEVLNYLAFTASGLSVDFQLARTPVSVGGIRVTVDGVEVKYSGLDGWTYDSATRKVEFHGSSIPGPNAVIQIAYPVQGGC